MRKPRDVRSSALTVFCLVGSPVLLLAFVRYELGVEHPMIQMRMFRERSFSLAMTVMLCGPDARYITGQTIHVNGGGFMP